MYAVGDWSCRLRCSTSHSFTRSQSSQGVFPSKTPYSSDPAGGVTGGSGGGGASWVQPATASAIANISQRNMPRAYGAARSGASQTEGQAHQDVDHQASQAGGHHGGGGGGADGRRAAPRAQPVPAGGERDEQPGQHHLHHRRD